MEIQIYACVRGDVKQVIELDIEITKKEFLEGLKTGKYATTVSHGEASPGNVIELHPVRGIQVIGKVTEQKALDDMELYEFELRDDYKK